MVEFADIPELTTAQMAAAECLASGGTVRKAAKTAGVSPTTVFRWNTQKDFSAHVTALHRASHGVLIGKLSSKAEKVGDAAIKLLEDPTTPATVRLATIKFFAETLNESINLKDLELKIAELDMKYLDLNGRVR